MASDKKHLDFVLDQMSPAGNITAKKMFGEYGIYCDGTIVALFCDNQLFVKPTEGGKNFIQNPVEFPPYPGAKPYFLIEEKIEDREWLSQLIRTTVQDLPLMIKRTKRKTSRRGCS